jgi:defect-in-organelle-trafficking protein DotC
MKSTLLGTLAWMTVSYAYSAATDQIASAPTDIAAQSTDETAMTLDTLLSLPAKGGVGANGIRAKLLSDAGQTVGFRAGMANRAQTLTKKIDARTAELDALFQFSTLVRPDGTLPPVIVEATDVASFSTDQFRLAGHVYRIEKEERFVSVPPTWRNYLFAGLSRRAKVELPVPEARPQDEKELIIWREAVRSGWQRGEREADAVLDANFSRLTRDYTGMILYSPLLATGMILPTKVAESAQTVTGDARQLTLNDTLRRLTSKARFETNADKWVPVISGGARTATVEDGQVPDEAPAARENR